MKLLIALLAAAASLCAAIEGTVVNKTSGRPQPGVTVVLSKLGPGGMQQGGSAVSGADGRFRIDADAASAHLLQAAWQGVTYNLSLQPGAPATNLEFAIFEALPRVSAVDVTQHMILFESNGEQLVVNETIVYQNDSQTTWHDPRAGTARVSVPAEAGDNVRARVIAPGGMPIERPVNQGANGVWSVDYPVKPGETRFDFSYRMPVSGPARYTGRILHDGGLVRLVIPQGIEVEGEGISSLGTEPSTRAAIYDVTARNFQLTLTGAGELRSPEPETAADDAPRIARIAPPGYDRVWKYVLGLAVAFLALGFWAQYLKGAPAEGKRKA